MRRFRRAGDNGYGKGHSRGGKASGLYVTWLPAYGAEVRGGTAYAMVCAGEKIIANPVVEKASTAILMNGPSFDKFISSVLPGGLAIVNTSLVTDIPALKKLKVEAYAITDEAIKLGNVKVANMIAVGIYFAKKKIFSEKTLKEVIHIMAGERQDLLDVNLRALERGKELAGEK
jgi:2-oxoglutarate ferredoxin oxidoreductase subunit gamma